MKALSGTQISSHIKKSISAENEPEVIFFGSFILIGKNTKLEQVIRRQKRWISFILCILPHDKIGVLMYP